MPKVSQKSTMILWSNANQGNSHNMCSTHATIKKCVELQTNIQTNFDQQNLAADQGQWDLQLVLLVLMSFSPMSMSTLAWSGDTYEVQDDKCQILPMFTHCHISMIRYKGEPRVFACSWDENVPPGRTLKQIWAGWGGKQRPEGWTGLRRWSHFFLAAFPTEYGTPVIFRKLERINSIDWICENSQGFVWNQRNFMKDNAMIEDIHQVSPDLKSTIDLLLVSDCVYYEQSLEPLVNSKKKQYL